MNKSLIKTNNEIDDFCKFNFIKKKEIVINFLNKAEKFYKIKGNEYYLSWIIHAVRETPITAEDIILFFDDCIFKSDFFKDYSFDNIVEEIVIKLSRKGISGEDAKDQLKRYLSKFLKGECAG